MKKTSLLILSAFVAGIFVLMSFVIPQDKKQPAPWDIPTKYKKMENPHAGDQSLDRVGKMLFAKYCKSCHGNNGECDGPKARQLETFCGDFSSEEFQSATDGELYYKSFVGRDEMPNFEKKITKEEDRWAIVNHLRGFKK